MRNARASRSGVAKTKRARCEEGARVPCQAQHKQRADRTWADVVTNGLTLNTAELSQPLRAPNAGGELSGPRSERDQRVEDSE